MQKEKIRIGRLCKAGGHNS